MKIYPSRSPSKQNGHPVAIDKDKENLFLVTSIDCRNTKIRLPNVAMTKQHEKLGRSKSIEGTEQ